MNMSNMFDKQPILVGGFIESTEFENIAEVYDLIRAYNMKNGKFDDNILANKFDQKLKEVMKNISSKNNQDDQRVRCVKGLDNLQ